MVSAFAEIFFSNIKRIGRRPISASFLFAKSKRIIFCKNKIFKNRGAKIMNTVTQLLNRDLIQIDETKDFSQVENKLKIKNPNVFYVANKKDIIENNDYLKFVRIVRGIDFIDVETTEGEKRFIEIKDAINFIKTRL
jgi:hypothetical protein